MINAINKIFEIYENYSGTSMMLVWFVLAVIYLWIAEKDKNIKMMFCYVLSVIGILFFCPIFAYIAMRYFLDSQTYYRVLWMLPMGIVVSYASVKLATSVPSVRNRKIFAAAIILCIAVTGQFIYSNKSVTMGENAYKLPSDVIKVADIMRVEGRSVKAAVPSEMLQFIRQYDASINLAYGRDALVEGWSGNPLYDAMESMPIRSWLVSDTAKQQGVEYLVIRTGTPIAGSKPISDYEFSYLTSVGAYDVYIFDRADFAEEKKEAYKGTGHSEHNENWINTAE